MSVFDQHAWDLQADNFEEASVKLLGKADPPPVEMLNEFGKGGFVFGCEHAGNRIPRSLGSLGLSKAERSRHIAWDIGAARLTQKLSEKMDGPAILQTYSRLVFDCNRTKDHSGAIVVDADGSHVSGNVDLTPEEKTRRETEFYRPFHNALSAVMDRRRCAGDRFSYVAVHSFNDEVRGEKRPWHVGFLYNQQPAMSHFLIDWFRKNTDFNVGNNQPYSPLDGVDHTLRVQAEVRSIPCTMIEVRNDLLRSDKCIAEWAALLTQALRAFEQHINT